MDVSELRKRILRALDDARKDVAAQRYAIDEAKKAYETFLTATAAPLMRQAAQVLNATGESFSVETPAESIRLVSRNSAHQFVELVLSVTRTRSQVIGRVSVARGRDGQIVEERPIADGKAIADLTEDDVSRFLVEEIPKLVVRS